MTTPSESNEEQQHEMAVAMAGVVRDKASSAYLAASAEREFLVRKSCRKRTALTWISCSPIVVTQPIQSNACWSSRSRWLTTTLVGYMCRRRVPRRSSRPTRTTLPLHDYWRSFAGLCWR